MDERGTRTLTQAVRTAVNGALLEVRTATPGRVESYDHTDQRATVTPLLRRKGRDGTVYQPRPIPNVPVHHPRAGGFAIHLPVSSGDVGLLLCSDRSLDRWLEHGGEVDPQSRRHHQITDAVFLPGLHHWDDPIGQTDLSDLTIAKEDGSVLLTLTSGGLVTIASSVGTHSEVLVDGTAVSFHTSLQNALSDVQAFGAAFGLPLANVATLIALLTAGTWKSSKLEAQP